MDASNQSDARASASSRTTTTRTTITRWVDGKNGLMPWAPSKAAWLVGAPLAALIVAGGSLYGVNRIQNDLTDKTRQDLVANNIDIDNLEIDFDHRDGTISGILPAGVTVDQVRNLVDPDGLRVLDLTGLQEQTAETVAEPEPIDEPEPTPPPEPEPAPVTEPAPATGPTEVSVDFAATAIVLRGEVLSEDQRSILVDAASERYGAENVTDELTVSGADEATPGADDRVGSLAALIEAVGDGVEGSGELTDTTLTFDGVAPDDAAAAAINDVVDAANGVTSTETNISVAAPSEPAPDPEPEASVDLPDEIISMQQELDALAGEIRETVVFASDSAELTPAAQATLDKAAAILQKYQLPVVQVTGHTDDRGSDGYNQELSAKRAAAVANYIVDQGVPSERIQSNGSGESSPIADNSTPAGQDENRRVELTALAAFA